MEGNREKLKLPDGERSAHAFGDLRLPIRLSGEI